MRNFIRPIFTRSLRYRNGLPIVKNVKYKSTMKMDEISFHKSADQCLHQIQDALDYLEDYDTIGPVDIYLSVRLFLNFY